MRNGRRREKKEDYPKNVFLILRVWCSSPNRRIHHSSYIPSNYATVCIVRNTATRLLTVYFKKNKYGSYKSVGEFCGSTEEVLCAIFIPGIHSVVSQALNQQKMLCSHGSTSTLTPPPSHHPPWSVSLRRIRRGGRDIRNHDNKRGLRESGVIDLLAQMGTHASGRRLFATPTLVIVPQRHYMRDDSHAARAWTTSRERAVHDTTFLAY